MDKVNNSFVFYATFLETIERLDNSSKELGNELMRAVIDYGIYGEYDNSNPIIDACMASIVHGIDSAKNRYEKAVEDGRKGGRNKIDFDMDKAQELKEQGKSYEEIAITLGVSKSTVQRRFNEQKKQQPTLARGVKSVKSVKRVQNLNDNVNDNDNENDNDNSCACAPKEQEAKDLAASGF